ncbi:CoA transferase, partial [Streptomyces bungoensis]|uniref:CoA transferase n=1 Tax=Streptomyces bungoensis TaxID=285568 RepID=UPI003678BA13
MASHPRPDHDRVPQRTRDEWAQLFADSDACVAPVLSLAEGKDHPHNRARETYLEADGIPQPTPSPLSPARLCGPSVGSGAAPSNTAQPIGSAATRRHCGSE